jgi:alkylated DNA repair dioxygenase AlkB
VQNDHVAQQRWAENGFHAQALGDGNLLYFGGVPGPLFWDEATFEAAWSLHPPERPVIKMVGRHVAIPRWQQAYGADYFFSGRVSQALPIPPLFTPLLEWVRQAIDPRLNGLLLNWYDGPAHYIGPHNDSEVGMPEGAPIVTISFGETRAFRLTRKGPGGRVITRDFAATSGSVFILPRQTNRAWKHAVPKKASYRGRRISVTVRAFETDLSAKEN